MNRLSISPTTLLYLSAAIIVSALMPSTQSFWIDEGTEALYADCADLESWSTLLTSDDKSNTQMPAAMLARWAWAQFTGMGEWHMRSLNIVWTLIAFAMCWTTSRREKMPILPVLFLASPFVWYYANEARPYSMIIAGGAILLDSVSRIRCETENGGPISAKSLWILLLGTGVAAWSAILSLFLLATLLPWTSWTLLKTKTPSARWLFPALLCIIALLPCTWYYLETLLAGAGGKKVTVTTIGLPGMVFSLYEFLGFSGLGPPRNILRESVTTGGIGGALKLLAPYMPLLLGLAALYTTTVSRGLSNMSPKTRWRLLGFAIVFVCLPSMLLIVAAIIKGASFWARHLAILFPFFAYVIAVPLSKFFSTGRTGKLLVAITICLLFASALNTRFNPRYFKEDYRGAAAIAKKMLKSGSMVWWLGDVATGYYYGLPITPKLLQNKLAHLLNTKNIMAFHCPDGQSLEIVKNADVIILTKPDIYDQKGTIQTLVESNINYQLTNDELSGFKVYMKHLDDINPSSISPKPISSKQDPP